MDLPDRSLRRLDRRGLLAAALVSAATARVRPAAAHNDAGAVDPPLSPPELALTLHDKQRTTLKKALAERVTALQLILTSCQATCPMQAALFAETARKLGDSLKSAQLLSISIDPARDDPDKLAKWLERFGHHRRWRAARPDEKQLDALVSFLKSKKSGPDPHTAQVYFFNRRGELALRSVDFPPAKEVLRLLGELERRG
jgi:protein SCO1/2